MQYTYLANHTAIIQQVQTVAAIFSAGLQTAPAGKD
jgi:hypothetical protein